MARITPSTGTFDIEAFADMEPYRVRLKAFKIEEKDHPTYGRSKRLEVTWELPDDPDNAPRDWMSLKLGKQQDGQVSKLRMLLNALAKQPKDAEIAWFDDATYEWSYEPNGAPFSTISEGQEVILRGESVLKEDGSGRAFKIRTYQSEVSRRRRPVPASVGAGEDSEPPF